MSMRDYAVDDYGLVLFSDDLRLLAEKIVDDFSECDWENDMYSIIEDVVDKLGVEYISSFTGETYQLLDDGDVDWADSDFFNDDMIYYIHVSKYPNIFEKAYESMDELLAEFKEKIGKYLPNDFDFRGHTRHIVGTYFG